MSDALRKDIEGNLARLHKRKPVIVFGDGIKPEMLPPVKRWKAIISYDDLGLPDGCGETPFMEYEFEELYELHHIIESGPNFYSVAKIEIIINPAIDRKEMLK
jgi:hypothetical protein